MIGRSAEELQKNNQDYYISVLQTNANTFSSQENILSQIAFRISLDETIQKPLRHNSTEYSLYAAAESLHNYGTEVLSVDHAGVFYTSEGYLLINGVKYSIPDFCAKYYPTDSAEARKMESFFNELQSMDYYAVTDSSTLFAARPISLGAAGRNDAVAFFSMNADVLEQNYCISVSIRASFALLNSEGDFLIRGDDFQANISAEVLSEFLASDQNVCAVDSNQNLLLYRYTDPESGFTYLLSVDKNESERKLVDFVNQVRTIMFFVLVLICISLAATLYINYRPIHHLLEKYSPKDSDQEIHSELERLDSAFFALDERMSTQRNLLVDFILGDLLFGNAVKQELVSQYFPVTHYRSFAVAAARCLAFTTAQAKQLAEQIMDVTGCSTHITRVPYRPHTVIVCLSEKMIDLHALQHGITDAIASVLGETCCVSMGDVVTDIYELRSSYLGSLTTESGIAGECTEINNTEFSQKTQVLIQCVYVGDAAEALAHLENIEEYIHANISSDGLRRYYCFKLINTYLTGINSSEAKLTGKDVDQILSFTTIPHLFSLLRDSIQRICSQVVETERTVDLKLQQKLVRYVDDNFRSSELCLTTAADYLDTSIYAVSRLFKEATGRGFKDYVTEKRLEYGHMLLCTTQSSVAEISAAAGFENSNYFSTVFKLKYGLPPTRYRKMVAEHQS